MLGLIAASLVLEKVLPMRIKEVAGRGICWGLMAITMTFLSLSTVGLLWVLVVQQVLPSLR
jgi:hypothetical protein